MAHDHVPNFVGASDNDLAVPSKSARPHRVKIMPEAYNWCSFAYISDTIFIDAIFLEELDEHMYGKIHEEIPTTYRNITGRRARMNSWRSLLIAHPIDFESGGYFSLLTTVHL
jgi:hypothetical protein